MKATRRTLYLFFALIVALALLAASSADAGFYRWIDPDGGDWADGGNWDYPGYPSLFFDFALFDLDASYQVGAADPALVQRIAGLTLAAGNVTLRTHEAFEAVLSIGPGSEPASLTLNGAITAPYPHVVGAHGTLILADGARLTSRAGDAYGFVVESGGVLEGSGVLDGHLLRNMGRLRPGSDAEPRGELVIGESGPGGYDQRSTGRLLVEISGPEAGVGYAPLRIADGGRGVSLDGTLEIVLADGYVPTAGDRYEVLLAPGYSGSFANVLLPEMDGRDFELLYEPEAVVIAVSGPSEVVLTLDIQPGACPNPLSVAKRGVVPAALMGAEGFSVRDIDPGSIRLEGVAPLRSGYADIGSPSAEDPCVCVSSSEDGIEDLTLKFPAEDLIAALGPVVDRQERLLTLTGAFLDGTPFVASDCVLVLAKGKKSGKKNAADAMITAAEPGLRLTGRPLDRVRWIAFDLAEPAPVRLSVFDVTGRRVAVLVDGTRPAGSHQVTWDAGDRPSGVYFIRLDTPAGPETARAVVLK